MLLGKDCPQRLSFAANERVTSRMVSEEAKFWLRGMNDIEFTYFFTF